MEKSTLNIGKENSTWIFLSAGITEVRHVEDIVFGIKCLVKVGVPLANIYVFTDIIYPEKIFKALDCSPNLYHIDKFGEQMKKLPDSEMGILIVGGHGSTSGITTIDDNTISPEALIKDFRTMPGMKGGVAVMTQCFAGLFNFINAGKTTPPLVVLGATNLNSSLSYPLTQMDEKIAFPKTWVANVFHLNFFNWIKNSIDVDGDGTHSLMDAYKFAGVFANDFLIKIKRRIHLEIDDLKDDLATYKLKHKDEIESEKADIVAELEAKEKIINQALERLYLHQEPWILNANLARAIKFW